MPTYTFQCPQCRHQFTGLFSLEAYEGKGVACPKCHHRGVKRVFEGSFSIGKSSKSSCPTGTCPFVKK